MPPLAFRDPRQTSPGQAPSIISYGYGGGMSPPPATAGAADPYAEVRKWQEQVANLTERALTEQNAFNKLQLQQQREDAERALQNALQIARISAETSRYGTDVQRQTQLTQLKENARQFDANHGLAQAQSVREDRRLGLDFAKTATDYLSTPDRFFQAGDFIDMAGRALQGQGPQPYGATGTPQAKQYSDFYALAQYPMPSQQAPGGGQGGADPRNKALKAVFDAIPPSGVDGLTGNDEAALNAARAIYSTNLKPGTVERMRPGQQGILTSALRRGGFDPNDWLADYKSYGVGQGRASGY